jgi:hypothetical protein
MSYKELIQILESNDNNISKLKDGLQNGSFDEEVSQIIKGIICSKNNFSIEFFDTFTCAASAIINLSCEDDFKNWTSKVLHSFNKGTICEEEFRWTICDRNIPNKIISNMLHGFVIGVTLYL